VRHQTLDPWDRFRVSLEIVAAGVGAPGLAPTYAVQRLSDGYWWNGVGAWVVGYIAVAMNEPDATNQPGLYDFIISEPNLAFSVGGEGYRVKLMEASRNVLEYVQVDQAEGNPWDDARGDHVAGGSFGEGVKLAADAVDAAALATSAVDEIADGVWDESQAGHDSAGTLGRAVQRIYAALMRHEGATDEHTADAAHVPGTRFYGPNVPPTPRSDAYAGMLAVYVPSGGEQTLVRVLGIGSDSGDLYFDIRLLDGTAISGGTGIGDNLRILNVQDPSADEIMSEPMAAHTTDGTFGDYVRRMLSLRQHNVRVIYDTWNSANQPTHGYVYVYASKADLEADSAPYPLATGKYEVDAAFNGSLQPTEYTSTKES